MNNRNLRVGREIIPSARPGIHTRNTNTMRIRGPNDDGDDGGVDETDNVFSKCVRTPSPSPLMIKKNFQRRHSFDDSNETSDLHNSVSRQCAKSLPTFPSTLSCSQSGDNETDDEDIPFGTPKTNYNTSQHSMVHESTKSMNTQCNGTSNSILYYILGIIVVIFAYQAYYYLTCTQNIDFYDQVMFYEDLKTVGEQYDLNEDSILKLQTGVSTIFNKEDAGSFIFLYNSNNMHFDWNQFEEFMHIVASKSSKYLRNDSRPVPHAVMDMSNIWAQRDTDLRLTYKKDVQKSGIMLVKGIEKIPSEAAMAFHYYCDEYNPEIKKSAIFFTLDLAKCPATGKGSSIYEQVEQCLKKYWSGLPTDNIGPLLSRVVSTLIEVNLQ